MNKKLIAIMAALVSCVAYGQTIPDSVCGNKIVLDMTIGDAMSFYPAISYVKSNDGRIEYEYEKNDVLGFIEYNESDKYIYNHTIGYPDISYERAKSLFRKIVDEINSWGSYDKLKIVNDNEYIYDFDGNRMLHLSIIPVELASRYSLIADFWNNSSFVAKKYDTVSQSNLRLPLSVLRKKFPGMRSYGSSGDMLVYLDGDVSEGIYSKFFVKNNRVVKEQLIVRSNDGFAKEWFDTMHKSLSDKGGWLYVDWGTNRKKYNYGNFKISLSYGHNTYYYETILEYEVILSNN